MFTLSFHAGFLPGHGGLGALLFNNVVMVVITPVFWFWYRRQRGADAGVVSLGSIAAQHESEEGRQSQWLIDVLAGQDCPFGWSQPYFPPPICLKSQTYPSFAPPLCWGIWAWSLAFPARIPACPSSLQRDVGSSSLLDRGLGGPRKWEAQVVHHENRPWHMSWSISLIFPASNKLTQPVSLKQQVATKKKTVTTPIAETTQWGQ